MSRLPPADFGDEPEGPFETRSLDEMLPPPVIGDGPGPAPLVVPPPAAAQEAKAPEITKRKTGRPRSPMIERVEAMRVGDSLSLEGVANIQSIRNAASRSAATFTIRRVGPDDAGAYHHTIKRTA